MRVFTAVFYLLFFSLTVWGQTRRADRANAAKSQICAAALLSSGEKTGIYIRSRTAVASSLDVSLR